jgi:ATP-binding cassette subfamily C (CFTR/MRP) protein 1
MTISIQRWLTLRLDLLGNVLVLGIALFAAGFRHTINPAKIGVVLSYTLSSKYCRAYGDVNLWLTVYSSYSDIL